MGCPGVGPCSTWDLDLSCVLTPSGSLPDPCLLEGQPVPQSVIDKAKLAASQLLWAMTGRQFGCCTSKIRPCRKKCEDACCGNGNDSGFPWTPKLLADGSWTNVACDCKDGCSCTNLCEINLPYPVCSLDEVKIDGIVLGASQFLVYDFSKLVRYPLAGVPSRIELDGAVGPVGGPIVKGLVSVTGPGATTDGTGIILPTDGATYTISTGNRTDWMLEFDVPVGCLNNDLSIFGINGGAFEVDVIDGGVTVVGPIPLSQNITFPNTQISGHRVKLRIRSTQPGALVGSSVNFKLNNTCGLGVRLTAVQWTEPSDKAQCWPECNDLSKPDSEIGTWSVTVTHGNAIPEMVRIAAEEFAGEIIKGCMGKSCKLPQRMGSISRQGVTVSFLDDMAFLDKGLTGMYFVDLAARTYNPHRLMRRPAVYSPDSANQWKVATWQGERANPSCD